MYKLKEEVVAHVACGATTIIITSILMLVL